MRARAMPVRLLISAHRKLRYVRQHRAPRHMDVHVARALATFFSRHEIDLANIGNKVGMENTAVIFGEVFAVFGEKFGIAGIETVFEHVIRVEDKLRVAEELEGYRLARQGKVPARLG